MRVIGCRWPRRGPGAGTREIHPLGIQPRAQRCVVEFLLPCVECRFQLLLGGVQHLADPFALFGRELAHALADFRQRALAPRRFNSHRFQLLGGGSGSDPRKGTRRQFLYGFVKHVMEISL